MRDLDQLRSDIAARLHALSDDDVRFVDKLVRALARMAQEECQGVELRPETVAALGIEARTVHVCGTCQEVISKGECGCPDFAEAFSETGGCVRCRVCGGRWFPVRRGMCEACELLAYPSEVQ